MNTYGNWIPTKKNRCNKAVTSVLFYHEFLVGNIDAEMICILDPHSDQCTTVITEITAEEEFCFCTGFCRAETQKRASSDV